MEAKEKEVQDNGLFFIDRHCSLEKVDKAKNNINGEILLPIGIFDNESLSPLETVTKYLKEDVDLRFKDIALLLNRSQKTVWNAYNESKNKTRLSLNLNKINKKGGFFIPSYVFTDRTLSFLESLTEYIRDNFNLRYCQIALLLHRDQRTIWTVYQRAKRKRRFNRKLNGKDGLS